MDVETQQFGLCICVDEHQLPWWHSIEGWKIHTVDGRNSARFGMYQNPVNNEKKLLTSTGEPDFFHQQYLSGWGQTGAFSVSIYAEIGTILWNVRVSVLEVAIKMNGSRCIPILALIAHQVKVIWCNCQKANYKKNIKTTLLHEWSGHQSSGEIPRWII